MFFSDLSYLWQGLPACALARQILILHTTHNTDIRVLTQFKSPHDPQWIKYIKEESPSFMILSEAANLQWMNEGDSGATKGSSVDVVCVEYLLESLVIACLGSLRNCAFTSSLEVSAAWIRGFHINTTRDDCSFYSKVCWLVEKMK